MLAARILILFTLLFPAILTHGGIEELVIVNGDDVVLRAHQRFGDKVVSLDLIKELLPSQRWGTQRLMDQTNRGLPLEELGAGVISPHICVYHEAEESSLSRVAPVCYGDALIQLLFPGDRQFARANRWMNDPINDLTCNKIAGILRLLATYTIPGAHALEATNLEEEILALLTSQSQRNLLEMIPLDVPAFKHLEEIVGVKIFCERGCKRALDPSEDIFTKLPSLKRKVEESERPLEAALDIAANVLGIRASYPPGEIQNGPQTYEEAMGLAMGIPKSELSSGKNRKKIKEALRLMRKNVFAHVCAQAFVEAAEKDGFELRGYQIYKAFMAFLWQKAEKIEDVAVFYNSLLGAASIDDSDFEVKNIADLTPHISSIRQNPGSFFALAPYLQDFVAWRLELDYSSRIIPQGEAKVDDHGAFADCVESVTRNMYLQLARIEGQDNQSVYDFSYLPPGSPAREYFELRPTGEAQFTTAARNMWAKRTHNIPGVRYANTTFKFEVKAGALSFLTLNEHLLNLPLGAPGDQLDTPKDLIKARFSAIGACVSTPQRRIEFIVEDNGISKIPGIPDFEAEVSIKVGDKIRYKIDLENGHATFNAVGRQRKLFTANAIVDAADTPHKALIAARFVRSQEELAPLLKYIGEDQKMTFLSNIDDEDPKLAIELLKLALKEPRLAPWKSFLHRKLYKLKNLDDMALFEKVGEALLARFGEDPNLNDPSLGVQLVAEVFSPMLHLWDFRTKWPLPTFIQLVKNMPRHLRPQDSFIILANQPTGAQIDFGHEFSRIHRLTLYQQNIDYMVNPSNQADLESFLTLVWNKKPRTLNFISLDDFPNGLLPLMDKFLEKQKVKAYWGGCLLLTLNLYASDGELGHTFTSWNTQAFAQKCRALHEKLVSLGLDYNVVTIACASAVPDDKYQELGLHLADEIEAEKIYVTRLE